MYGLFAYKEITALRTKHVYRLEIYKKDFSGTAMELEEFNSSPFSITLEGEGDEVYRPVIKSSLSINIIDKDQFDYTQFFTSDAFGFRVFLLRNGVRLWSGYITPDSFGQDLQYRSTINLVARDNIGYLSEIDYDWFDYDFVSIEQLLTKAFDKIQAQFSLDNRVNIFSGNKPITDAYIQTVGLKDKTWFEVLEEVLSGCGLQLRYINDNYTLHDIANEVELGGNYTPTFIDRSQRVDFSPAWREEQLEQDYLKIDNFFNKMPNKDKYEFIKLNNKDFSRPGERLYTIQGWNQSEANASNGILFNNPDELYYNTSFNQDTGTYIFDKIPNTSMLINSDNKTEYPNSSISTSFICKKSSTPLHINIDAFNELFEVEYYEGIGHVISRHYGFNYNTYHLNFYCNIFLKKEDGSTLICKNNTWEPYDSSNQDYRIELNLPETPDPLTAESFQEDKTQLDIVVKSIPENGDLIFTIYRWGTSYTGTLLGSFAMRIDNIKMYFKDEKEDISGQESKITINESNNVKQSFDFKYGQIPDSSGGYLAFAGGLHDNDDYHTPLTDWYRSAFPGNKYNLLELVGRGLAHHGKKARKIMTGTILFDGQDFSKILVIDNEKYVINGGTYDVTKETLTGEFIEVEPYSTDDYVITGGAVSGGSSNISTGGNRDTLLWTDNAANTKRVNELGVATSDDLAGSNLLIDNPEWSEAKRISADMLDDKFYWDKSLDTTEDKSDKDSWIIRTKHSIVSDKGISAYGLGPTSGGGASDSLGELVNVGQWADEVPTADRVMVQLAGATHWSAKPLADLVGLDTAALAQYLTANSYLKASDISSYLTWANLSGKPTVYPTSWELVTGRPTKLSDLTDDVVAGNYLPKPTWDAVFEVVTVDGTPVLKVKYDILGLKGITAYADGTLSGGFSGALVDLVDVAVTNLASGDILKYNGTHFVNVPVSSIAGASSWDQITGKPEYYPTRWADVSGAPTSLPASDVYPWAKAASKPTYTAAEVGALALSGGVLAGDVYLGGGLAIRDNTASHSNVIGLLNTGDGTFFTAVGSGNRRMVLYSSVDLYRDNGSTQYRIYDSSNFNPSSKLDKSVWDEAFELKTVNGVRVISAKLDFLSVAGISAYATGPSSGGGGGGLDYDLLKQALTGAITPDGYPFTISASFLGAIDKTYLTGKLANTYANKVHTHLWADITDRPTALPASDVYPWAKAASKPTYTAAEVGALALSGGVLAGDVYLGGGLAIRDNTASHSNVIGLLNTGDGTFFTAVGSGNRRMVLYSSVDLYRDNGSTQYRIYDSSNFNPSSKLDKSVWDEAFELKTVNGVRVISAKLDFLSVAGISAYATGPSSGGGGGGLDYDLLKQALTGAITPDGYPFTISASFLGAIDKTYLTGKLANTYANKVHTHLWADITDRPTALPANGGNAESAIKDGNGNVIANTYLPLTGNKTITGSLTVANGFTSGIMKCQTGAYPQLQFEQTNTGVTSILFVNPGNALMYRPNEAEPSKDYTVYHSGNFNPDRKFGLSDIISDLNNAPLNAVFSTNGTPANAPLENAYFQGFTFAMDNNPDFKRQWAFKDKKIWFRNLHAGSWSAWTDVIPLDNYLPLSGNKMITGDFQFKDGVSVRDAAGRSVVGLLDVAGDGVCVVVGNSAKKTRIVTPNDTPVYRNDGKGAYRIYDSSNSNISTVDWAAKNITAAGTVTATKLVLGGITIDVYNGALRVNGNLVATGGVTSLATA